MKKHFRQWIQSNIFTLQIKHPYHKPFELHAHNYYFVVVVVVVVGGGGGVLDFTTNFNILGHQRRFRHRALKSQTNFAQRL